MTRATDEKEATMRKALGIFLILLAIAVQVWMRLKHPDMIEVNLLANFYPRYFLCVTLVVYGYWIGWDKF